MELRQGNQFKNLAPASRIVYLDQKNWIELARGYYHRTPAIQKIAQIVVKKSESGQAIFPLSLTHFDETIRNLNRDRRQRLAKYMMRVSQGWAILPAPFIVDLEIEDACLKHQGLNGYDLQNIAIRKGLSQLVGAKADLEIENKDPSHPLPQELERKLPDLKRYLLKSLETPEALLFLMEFGIDQSQLKEKQERSMMIAEELEQIRSSVSLRIKDNDLRRRAAMANYFVTVINPKLIKFLTSIHVDPEIFGESVD